MTNLIADQIKKNFPAATGSDVTEATRLVEEGANDRAIVVSRQRPKVRNFRIREVQRFKAVSELIEKDLPYRGNDVLVNQQLCLGTILAGLKPSIIKTSSLDSLNELIKEQLPGWEIDPKVEDVPDELAQFAGPVGAIEMAMKAINKGHALDALSPEDTAFHSLLVANLGLNLESTAAAGSSKEVWRVKVNNGIAHRPLFRLKSGKKRDSMGREIKTTDPVSGKVMPVWNVDRWRYEFDSYLIRMSLLGKTLPKGTEVGGREYQKDIRDIVNMMDAVNQHPGKKELLGLEVLIRNEYAYYMFPTIRYFLNTNLALRGMGLGPKGS